MPRSFTGTFADALRKLKAIAKFRPNNFLTTKIGDSDVFVGISECGSTLIVRNANNGYRYTIGFIEDLNESNTTFRFTEVQR